MGRTPGSKNKPKSIEEVREKMSASLKEEKTMERTDPPKKSVVEALKPASRKISEKVHEEPSKEKRKRRTKEEIEADKYREAREESKPLPVDKDNPPVNKETKSYEDPPRVPVCYVDGGYLYRFLYELRRNCLEDKTKFDEIRLLNEMMDYIMRMEKKTEEDRERLLRGQ